MTKGLAAFVGTGKILCPVTLCAAAVEVEFRIDAPLHFFEPLLGRLAAGAIRTP